MTALGNVLALIRELDDESADSLRMPSSAEAWIDSADSDSRLGEVINFIRETQANGA